ncbi:hypothetical protein FEM48_Zijuj01G0315500 [Ziziphus jujuba var. spinosa]|uniref:Protein kinase domain-containing protein n=1 Tax=Ziziphus jujuba var. spinosa TaxID=714518 RepID=A0A978W6A5_ZIZJJ|nr:hypothetical protein FEM48_Zijuj01G0315500 [Ziziphus jujuba var. spinosa]
MEEMEICQNGEKVLSWEIKLRISTRLANALAYLHEGASRVVIHRDIMPSIILFEILTGKKIRDLFNCMDDNAFGSPESSKEACLNASMLEYGNSGQVMECAEVALSCVRMNPDGRPSMKEVAQALR